MRVVDVFAGAGGLSEGFRQAGFEVAAGSDVDPDACASFALNFPEAETICGDIRDPVTRAAFLAAAEGCEVVVGGPPCQAFSQVRNHSRLIEDPRNSLYREFVEVVRAVQPLAFVMENVQGLEQVGVRDQVVQDLSLDGAYRVHAQLVDAANFGVPQTRRRLLFIGMLADIGVEPAEVVGTGATRAVTLTRRNGSLPLHYFLDAPAAANGKRHLQDLLDPETSQLVSAAQAIGDLEDLPAPERTDALPAKWLAPAASAYQREMRFGLGAVLTNTSVPRMNEDTRLRLAAVPPGGNHLDLPVELRERYLTGAKWGPDNGSGLLGRRHYYAYRRLHPEIWSWTLNTKADSVYHYSRARALSVREFARLQSFPDRFTFTTDPRPGPLPGRITGGAGHSRYRQAGNAVPPLLARAIATSIGERLRIRAPVEAAV